ncbi:LuxR C-terminal-related transcriptional regulator [Microbacterium sp. LWH7-1.2]|uniref:LuxR C-terminal-related transcriptional regulator n=1 Tax=Microbacterium sp. LWH7-1.2 TaxID=3135257 RepID=UPI003138AE69
MVLSSAEPSTVTRSAPAPKASENTVKFHVSNLLRKSGAASRTELVALARG